MARADTRGRLLDVALELFTDRGFERVTVGDIERAAGLAPRSGALYQYFRSKEDLLNAALTRAAESLDDLDAVLSVLPLGDLRAEFTLLARWNLASLRRRGSLARFIARQSSGMPDAVRRDLYERLVGAPYAKVGAWLRARLNERPGGLAADADLDAYVLVLIESMAGHRALQSTFGRVPGDVDDERYVQAWVHTALALASSLGLAPAPSPLPRVLGPNP